MTSPDVHEHLRSANLNLQAIAYAWDPRILPQSSQLIADGEYTREDLLALAAAIARWGETIGGIAMRLYDLQDALIAYAEDVAA